MWTRRQRQMCIRDSHYDDASKVAEAQAMIEGDPMKGDELETLEVRLDQRGW